MKQYFVKYTKEQIPNGDDIQNFVFEIIARCVCKNIRVIIEQSKNRGEKYIMVDFNPTDGSNTEFMDNTDLVCAITSCYRYEDGNIYETFKNYFDACKWLSEYLIREDYVELYTECY